MMEKIFRYKLKDKKTGLFSNGKGARKCLKVHGKVWFNLGHVKLHLRGLFIQDMGKNKSPRYKNNIPEEYLLVMSENTNDKPIESVARDLYPELFDMVNGKIVERSFLNKRETIPINLPPIICFGVKCMQIGCSNLASHKIADVTPRNKHTHELTTYLCTPHFDRIMMRETRYYSQDHRFPKEYNLDDKDHTSNHTD